jgi:hypothetical protein
VLDRYFIRETLDLECLLSAVLVDPAAPTGQVIGWTPPENVDAA